MTASRPIDATQAQDDENFGGRRREWEFICSSSSWKLRSDDGVDASLDALTERFDANW